MCIDYTNHYIEPLYLIFSICHSYIITSFTDSAEKNVGSTASDQWNRIPLGSYLPPGKRIRILNDICIPLKSESFSNSFFIKFFIIFFFNLSIPGEPVVKRLKRCPVVVIVTENEHRAIAKEIAKLAMGVWANNIDKKLNHILRLMATRTIYERQRV